MTELGISAEDFNTWKHHPASKVVLQYLRDKRLFIERLALDQWIAGALTLTADQTMRGQIIELFEIENLPFEAIESFYFSDEDRNANETTED